MVSGSPRLLIAASGTGGHLFPALAVAEALTDFEANFEANFEVSFEIEWLGVPDRLETQLVGDRYPLQTIPVAGFQEGLSLKSLKVLVQLIRGIFQVRRYLKRGKFQGVFTTGGYIAGPAILAARSLGLPVVLHESNALPGKVTRWLSPWCTQVALGFDSARRYLPKARTVYVGTPVRSAFRAIDGLCLELPIPPQVPLLVVMGGSQGAVAVNQLVRACAPAWLEAGIWIVHLTGEADPDRHSLQHEHYLSLPFYDHMAPLLHRADLAVSRAGASALTELAITGTPAILIPYPYAAEDHQTYNGRVFAAAAAALLFQQAELTPERLQTEVLNLLALGLERNPTLKQMAYNTRQLAVVDSDKQLAQLIRQLLAS